MSINQIFELAIKQNKNMVLMDYESSKYPNLDYILYKAQGIIENEINDPIERNQLWNKLISIQNMFEIENH